jgi:hypothetical protein
VASKEIGLEVNTDKSKYAVMSQGQNAGRNHSMRNDNSSFEMLEVFKYLGTNLNKNSVQDEIKRRMSQGKLATVQCRILCLPVCYPNI